MQMLRMNAHGQVTIPIELRKKIHCRAGDYFQIRLEKSGLKIVPTTIIDPSQAWFWTKEWQEKEAEENLKKGRRKTFKSTKEAIEYLKGLSK